MGVGDDELHPAQAAAGELAEERDPERLGLRRADVHAENLAPAVGVDAHGDDHRHRDDAPVLTHLQVGRVDPEVGPVSFERTLEERRHPLVDLGAEPANLALRHAAHPERLHEVVDRARRDAVDVGLLDDGRQRFLRHAPRLEEAGEVAAPAQLRDAQLHRSRACLPDPVAVAVTLDQPVRALLAPVGAGQAAHLQFHQPLGGKADHLPKHVSIGGLLDQAAQGHRLVGHRGSPVQVGVSNPTLPKNPRWPPRRRPLASASIRAGGRRRYVELHHYRGHDPFRVRMP